MNDSEHFKSLSMKVFNMPRMEEVDRMKTLELRSTFLVERVFEAGKISLLYTSLDRMVIGGVAPVLQELSLSAYPQQFGTEYFTFRRELGIINIGDPGTVVVGTERFHLKRFDCLYVGIEEEDVRFHPASSGKAEYYLVSCPAHNKYPTRQMSQEEARHHILGDSSRASRRRLIQYICPGGIRSSQLLLGLTELEEGSVWNTLPPHTHSRRSEIYFYFDLGENVVLHLMGRPDRTQHLFVRDRQAVLSPPWSIHAGAGSGNYRFIWGMAGENQDFNDMDPVALNDLA